LKDAGDDIHAEMLITGLFPISPMIQSSGFADLPTVRALMDAGAPVDQADGDGLTSLSWAAIADRVDLARLLIEHGADVNHVDKKGMTPLLYAASIDFGDGSMAALLLKAGANAKVRTKEGFTAGDLARKYGHAQVLKAAQASGLD